MSIILKTINVPSTIVGDTIVFIFSDKKHIMKNSKIIIDFANDTFKVSGKIVLLNIERYSSYPLNSIMPFVLEQLNENTEYNLFCIDRGNNDFKYIITQLSKTNTKNKYNPKLTLII